MAEGLASCFHGEFAKRIQVLEEEQLSRTGRYLTGRQLGWHMDQHFRLGDAEGTILDFQDLRAVKLKGDNLAAFQNEWEMTLSGMTHWPSWDILESMYRTELLKSIQFQHHMMMYENALALKKFTIRCLTVTDPSNTGHAINSINSI